MKARILLIASLSLLVGSCGKTEDSETVVTTPGDIQGQQVTEMGETRTIEETKAAMETATPSEMVTSAPVSTEQYVDGEAVYKRSCISCHLTGAAGAPKVGDVPVWESRIAKGTAALVQSAISGVPGTAMIARGSCAACSDEEITAAVEYMIAQSR